jgi:hypothetical protein
MMRKGQLKRISEEDVMGQFKGSVAGNSLGL